MTTSPKPSLCGCCATRTFPSHACDLSLAVDQWHVPLLYREAACTYCMRYLGYNRMSFQSKTQFAPSGVSQLLLRGIVYDEIGLEVQEGGSTLPNHRDSPVPVARGLAWLRPRSLSSLKSLFVVLK